jgi:uncharacterized protein YjbI with pentapeptide repeats
MAADSELYYLLKNEKIEEFNKKVVGLKSINLVSCNLRGRNISSANLRYADLRGAYLSHCNLKGLNFSNANLEGASIHFAKISGVYFPKNISSSEVSNSLNYGTRIRTTDSEVFDEADEPLLN